MQALTAQAAAGGWTRPPSRIDVAGAPGPRRGPDSRPTRWVAPARRRCARRRATWSTLRELRYVDPARIDELGRDAGSRAGRRRASGPSSSCSGDGRVRRRTTPTVDALVARRGARSPRSPRPAPVAERLAEQADGLQVVTEVVGALDIADATVRTRSWSGSARCSAASTGPGPPWTAGAASCWRSRAGPSSPPSSRCSARRSPARSRPRTPRRRCDEQLARLLLQLEDLESRFGEFDDFLGQLGRQAHRGLRGVRGPQAGAARRAGPPRRPAGRLGRAHPRQRAAAGSPTLASLDEVNTYFAADPMVAKLRSVAERAARARRPGPGRGARRAGSRPPARRPAGRCATAPTCSATAATTIRLGRHRFAVNTQADRPDARAARRRGMALRGHRHRLPRAGPRRRRSRRPGRSGTSRWSPRRRRSTAPSTWPRRSSPPSRAGRAARGRGRRRRCAIWCAGPPRPATTRATSAACTTTTRPRSSTRCCGCTPAPACCATRRRRGPRRSCSGRSARRPTRAGAGRARAASLARARAAFGSAPAIDDLRDELCAAMTRSAATAGLPTDGARRRVPGRGAGRRAGRLRHQRRRADAARPVPPRARRPRQAAREFDDDLRALGDDLAARHQLVHGVADRVPASQPDGRRRRPAPRRSRSSCAGAALTRHDSSAALTRHRRGPARRAPADRRAAPDAAARRAAGPDPRGSATSACRRTAPTSSSATSSWPPRARPAAARRVPAAR